MFPSTLCVSYKKGIYVQWHFLLLQGTTCSLAIAACQILLWVQAIRPRKCRRDVVTKCHFKFSLIILRLHTADSYLSKSSGQAQSDRHRHVHPQPTPLNYKKDGKNAAAEYNYN